MFFGQKNIISIIIPFNMYILLQIYTIQYENKPLISNRMQSSNPGNAAERSPRNTSATVTQVVQQDEEDGTLSEEQLRMRLDVPDNRSRVHWTSNTVDNENMGKKKSKCCCIYKKKRDWNESESSDEDCESRHCRGHMECHRKPPDGGNEGGGGPGPSVPS